MIKVEKMNGDWVVCESKMVEDIPLYAFLSENRHGFAWTGRVWYYASKNLAEAALHAWRLSESGNTHQSLSP